MGGGMIITSIATPLETENCGVFHCFAREEFYQPKSINFFEVSFVSPARVTGPQIKRGHRTWLSD
jgi:hypothetical protein